MGVHSFYAWPKSSDDRPSHPYIVGEGEHVSRVTGACPVATDLTMRVKVRRTTTATTSGLTDQADIVSCAQSAKHLEVFGSASRKKGELHPFTVRTSCEA